MTVRIATSAATSYRVTAGGTPIGPAIHVTEITATGRRGTSRSMTVQSVSPWRVWLASQWLKAQVRAIASVDDASEL